MSTVAEASAAQAQYWCNAGPGKSAGGAYSVGYSQPDRESVYELSDEQGYLTADANADCGSLVMSAINYGFHSVLGIPWGDSNMFRLGDWWTGNLSQGLAARGYAEVHWDDHALYPDDGLKVGDVLLASGHVVMITAGGVSEAQLDENGGTSGVRGDQTGRETRTSPYESHWLTRGAGWLACFRFNGLAGYDQSFPWYVEPDGDWDAKTGARFRQVMGLGTDVEWTEACKALQYFLTWAVDAYHLQEATGSQHLAVDGVDGQATWKAFQTWWNHCDIPAGHAIPLSGACDAETIRAVQIALNHSWAGARALAVQP